MANLRWLGGASPVANVRTYTFGGTWVATDVVTVTIGESSVNIVTGSTVIATLLATIQAAYAALSATLYPEMSELTASNTSTTLVLTADTAGIPFTVSITTNSAAGTIAAATTVYSSGPNDWSTPLNWTGGKSGATTAATNATPISVTSTAHGLLSGDQITIAGVIGNTAANGQWVITKVDANTFTLNTSAGSGSYTSGGTWTAGPTNGDNVTLDYSSDDIKFGLSQTGITLASLTVTGTFTGTLGLPKSNTSGTTYPEYRPDYLQIGATVVNIGTGVGQTSGRIKHDAGSVACTWTVYNSTTGLETDLPAVLLKGTSASNVLSVLNGSIGVGIFGNESANLTGGLNIDNGSVICGTNVTLAAITQAGGTLITNTAIATSLTQLGGTSTLYGSGTCAQLTVQGGTCVCNLSGTLGGNTVVGAAGFIDFNQSQAALTVTNPIACYAYPGIQDDNRRISGLVVQYKQLQVPGFGFNPVFTRS